MTVFRSTDSGASWQLVRSVWPGSSAYSSLAPLNETHAALVWEADGYSRLSFLIV